MLTITREEGQSLILIDRDTGVEFGRLTVRAIRGKRVRIAIALPKHLLIHRTEYKGGVERTV